MITVPNSSRRSSGRKALTLALTMIVVAGTSVSAHRLDEYLQAARIDLQTDTVLIDLDLTPGVAIAESIISMIDRDRDGSMSIEEQNHYARQVVSAVQIQVDEEPVPLHLSSLTFPEPSSFRRGEGMIRLRAIAPHRSLSAGAHRLFFRNAHLNQQSVYLANALLPESARVAVTGQRRDGDQSELTIDYSIRPAWNYSTGMLVFVAAAVLMIRFRQFAGRRP